MKETRKIKGQLPEQVSPRQQVAELTIAQSVGTSLFSPRTYSGMISAAPVGQVLSAYIGFIVVLFALSAAVLGLKATLWGIGILHLGCAAGILALCWWEEHRWLLARQRSMSAPQGKSKRAEHQTSR